MTRLNWFEVEVYRARSGILNASSDFEDLDAFNPSHACCDAEFSYAPARRLNNRTFFVEVWFPVRKDTAWLFVGQVKRNEGPFERCRPRFSCLRESYRYEGHSYTTAKAGCCRSIVRSSASRTLSFLTFLLEYNRTIICLTHHTGTRACLPR